MRTLIFILFTFLFIETFAQEESSELNFRYALVEAGRLKALGDINEAVLMYRKCLEIKPESSVVLYELGSIYAAYKENDEAEKLLERAWWSDPDNYWYTLAYTQILGINKKDRLAVEILAAYLKKSRDVKLRFMYAESLFSVGKYNKALKVLNDIEVEYGFAELLALRRAEIYKKKKDFHKGENEFLRLIKIVPESPEYIILLAEYYEETGRVEESVRWYKKAYELDSLNVYAITNLADYYNKISFTSSGFYYLEKAFKLDNIKLENKINTIIFLFNNENEFLRNQEYIGKLVEILLEKYPDEFTVLTSSYDYYNKTGNNKKAYELITRIIKIKRDNYQIWRQLLYNASLENAYDDLIRFGNEALSYFPEKKEINLFIGIAWYQKENYELAWSVLKAGYQNEKDNTLREQFLLFLGEAAYKTSRFSDSFEYFEELLKLQPDNIPVKNNYSYYLAEKNLNLERAEVLSKATIDLEPENPTYLDTYAWILFKLGRFEDALIVIERAVGKDFDDPEILFHYSEILRSLGRTREADDTYQRAVSVGFSPESTIKND